MVDNSNICAEAISLLKALPRGASSESEVRARFESFRAPYAGIEAELVTTHSSIAENVDYDLLIEDAGGTIGVSWRPNNGIPWTVKYAEHHTAGKVLSVNGMSIEVQDVLLLLELAGGDDSTLRGRLLRYALIQHAIRRSPLAVSDVELQAAGDRFRRNRGLLSAEATQNWLKEVGLTPKGMEKFLCQIVQTGKLKKRVTQKRLRSFFEEHTEDFDVLRLAIVEAPIAASAAVLASEARKHGLLTATQTLLREHQTDADVLTCRLLTHRIFELPSSFLTASTGAIVGPTPDGNVFRITEVLNRKSVVFDSETRTAVENRLFDEWLDEQRREVEVRWYLR